MKLRKKVIAAILTCILLFTSSTIALAGTESGTLGGYTVVGSTSISSTGASASTTFYGSGGSGYVDATYSYVNVYTLETGSKSNGAGGTSGGSVSFYAPSNCRSVRVSAFHSVTWGSQRWTANTSAVY